MAEAEQVAPALVPAVAVALAEEQLVLVLGKPRSVVVEYMTCHEMRAVAGSNRCL